jgi:hypothetical protein
MTVVLGLVCDDSTVTVRSSGANGDAQTVSPPNAELCWAQAIQPRAARGHYQRCGRQLSISAARVRTNRAPVTEPAAVLGHFRRVLDARW